MDRYILNHKSQERGHVGFTIDKKRCLNKSNNYINSFLQPIMSDFICDND